jgi:hypothetical protein
MAYNNSEKVGDARDFAEKHDVDQVVILYVDRGSDQLGYASYGENEPLCDQAKRLADAAYDAVYEVLAAK